LMKLDAHYEPKWNINGLSKNTLTPYNYD